MQNKLPQGWVTCKFKDVTDLYTGNSISKEIKKQKYSNLQEGYDYISTKDIGINHKVYYENGVKIPFYEEKFKYAYPNDSLLCIEGGNAGKKSCMLNQKVCFGNKLCCFHAHTVKPSYIYYYIQSNIFFKKFKSNLSGLIGGVGLKQIQNMLIELPPLNEQKRIVEKIEEEFAKVDKGLEVLEKTKKQIKQYRQSVLKSAFDGKLYKTTEWKECLLDEICISITAGGDRPKIVSQKKSKKCSVPIFSNSIYNDGLYGYTNKPKILQNAVTVSARGTIGFVCARYQPFFPIVRLITLIPKKEKLILEFLKYYLQSIIPKGEGSSIPQLTVPNFKTYKIILPTLKEQQEIVTEIEKRFKVADEVEKVVNENIEKAKQLKQSILKKAFEGRLVPQDPTDEPASTLLEKIKKSSLRGMK